MKIFSTPLQIILYSLLISSCGIALRSVAESVQNPSPTQPSNLSERHPEIYNPARPPGRLFTCSDSVGAICFNGTVQGSGPFASALSEAKVTLKLQGEVAHISQTDMHGYFTVCLDKKTLKPNIWGNVMREIFITGCPNEYRHADVHAELWVEKPGYETTSQVIVWRSHSTANDLNIYLRPATQ